MGRPVSKTCYRGHEWTSENTGVSSGIRFCKICRDDTRRKRLNQKPRPTLQPQERFWSKVLKTDFCWIWTAAKRGNYGVFRVSNNWRVPAHRYSYWLANPAWDITDSTSVLDHVVCENTVCVNPQHLNPTTFLENIARDSKSPMTINRLKEFCPKGHRYSEENTHINAKGSRECLSCRKIRNSSAGRSKACF